MSDRVSSQALRSIAIPPLGSGNGGLDWRDVRPRIEAALRDFENVKIIVYEPTAQYQNVTKKKGKEELTPSRALVAEMVRRYSILGLGCSLLEVHKLSYFVERNIEKLNIANPMKLSFEVNRYGPYSLNLNHSLDGLDGSYLHCDKRLVDAAPSDGIWFNLNKKDHLQAYLRSEGKQYQTVLERTSELN